MLSHFEACLRHVLQSEGGYVDHPADPGGATKFGITQATLAAHRGRAVTKAEVKALTVEEAGAIYRVKYWDKVQGDALPAGVDLCVFDFAVNSGPKRAIMALQRAVGVADDGKLGPITMRAVSIKEPAIVIRHICTDRLQFLRRLSTWKTFGKGWGRRVAEVERASLGAVSKPTPVTPPPPDVEPVPAPAKPSLWARFLSFFA